MKKYKTKEVLDIVEYNFNLFKDIEHKKQIVENPKEQLIIQLIKELDHGTVKNVNSLIQKITGKNPEYIFDDPDCDNIDSYTLVQLLEQCAVVYGSSSYDEESPAECERYASLRRSQMNIRRFWYYYTLLKWRIENA